MSAHLDGLTVRPLRRTEYDRMVGEGLFEGEPIELLEGALVEMSPEKEPHSLVIQELNWLLARGLSEDVRVRIGHPWIASDISEPEPDVAVVAKGDYLSAHPSAALLLIEVARTSRRKDLGIKAWLYAAAGVPEYWVVDLRDELVHVHTDPTNDGYATIDEHGFDATLDAVGVPVRIADMLGSH